MRQIALKASRNALGQGLSRAWPRDCVLLGGQKQGRHLVLIQSDGLALQANFDAGGPVVGLVAQNLGFVLRLQFFATQSRSEKSREDPVIHRAAFPLPNLPRPGPRRA